MQQLAYVCTPDANQSSCRLLHLLGLSPCAPRGPRPTDQGPTETLCTALRARRFRLLQLVQGCWILVGGLLLGWCIIVHPLCGSPPAVRIYVGHIPLDRATGKSAASTPYYESLQVKYHCIAISDLLSHWGPQAAIAHCATSSFRVHNARVSVAGSMKHRT